MKKVMHLLASNSFSGAENVVMNIMKETQNNYKSIYCSPQGNIEKKLRESNMDYILLKKFSYFNIIMAIKKFNPDIIHAHDFKASLLASMFHKKAKIISHIHQSPKWSSNFNLKTLAFKIASKNFDKIIYVSNDARNTYYYAKDIKNKSSVIYNAINIEDIIKKSDDFEPPFYDFIYLGRLTDVKNPLGFLNIIKHFANCKAIMIGNGDQIKILEQCLAENNLLDNVDLVGFKKNPYPYLKRSKVCIIPSKNEGFSLSAIEAGALGIPVIANQVLGLEEIVKEIHGITYSSEQDAHEIINNLLENPQKYMHISETEKINVRNKFDINTFKLKILNLYKSL